MKKEKLRYKNWSDLTLKQRDKAKLILRDGQIERECRFGFNQNGELKSVLDYGAMRDIF